MSTEPKLPILYSKKEIAAAVKKLAAEIARDYKSKNPLVIGILKGSFVFLADLSRKLDFPLEIEFIRLSSYGHGQQSSGKVKVLQNIDGKIKDRDVLVIEDIIDSGVTLSFLLDYLQKKQPASLKLCCLLDKPARRRVPVKIDYTGIVVPDKFLVGYGLDWDEKYRNLPDICYVEE
jgi:hypoxanthine phosphoribosyltransferase